MGNCAAPLADFDPFSVATLRTSGQPAYKVPDNSPSGGYPDSLADDEAKEVEDGIAPDDPVNGYANGGYAIRDEADNENPQSLNDRVSSTKIYPGSKT